MIFVGIPIRLGAMNAAFGVWLDRELQARGWSQSEAARRGEMSSQMVNALVNGQSNPGLDSCQGIARAFKMPLEDVFRLAGILPAKLIPPELRVNQRGVVYNIDTEERGRRIMAAFNALSVDDQVLIMAMIERLAGVEPRIIGERPEES
jgi:transcriptional regulator with XRE-family HTH domain